MRKIVYSMFIIISLFISSVSLVSCEAITAQNINMNSVAGINGGKRTNYVTDGTGNQGNNRNKQSPKRVQGRTYEYNDNGIEKN